MYLPKSTPTVSGEMQREHSILYVTSSPNTGQRCPQEAIVQSHCPATFRNVILAIQGKTKTPSRLKRHDKYALYMVLTGVLLLQRTSLGRGNPERDRRIVPDSCTAAKATVYTLIYWGKRALGLTTYFQMVQETKPALSNEWITFFARLCLFHILKNILIKIH